MTPRNALTVVATPPETTAQRAAALFAQSRQAATDHIAELAQSMAETMRLASEVGVGSDAYPPGVRDLARRLALHLKSQGDSIEGMPR